MPDFRNTIKPYLLAGKYPTQAQFFELLETIWFKDEKLATSDINGLDDIIAELNAHYLAAANRSNFKCVSDANYSVVDGDDVLSFKYINAGRRVDLPDDTWDGRKLTLLIGRDTSGFMLPGDGVMISFVGSTAPVKGIDGADYVGTNKSVTIIFVATEHREDLGFEPAPYWQVMWETN